MTFEAPSRRRADSRSRKSPTLVLFFLSIDSVLAMELALITETELADPESYIASLDLPRRSSTLARRG